MATGAPWARPSLPGPRPGLWPAHASWRWPTHARRMVTPRGHGQNKVRGNEPHSSAIMPLYDDLGEEAGKGVLTGGLDDAVEEDNVDGETSLQWKKVLQDQPHSCARGPRTLGTTWPAMRSTEEGAHRWSTEVSNMIRCRG
jgi:hypothetical protein